MPDPIAVTTAGRVQGLVERGAYAFKGVPYGASTAGTRRFLPPLPVAPWDGVRDATRHGPICPQTGALVDSRIQESMGPMEYLPQNEDCLLLNVWTPGLGDGAKRPVMMWLHGRGFAAGAGSEPVYNGANLAKRGDAVIVTINHRLNVFGHLHLADLGGEKWAGSGVAGMLDAVLALEWIRENIEVFGGDAGNVTIFGESGGGAKVSTLLAMPSARGLFHKAIIQSGPSIRAVDAREASQLAGDLLGALGIGPKEIDRVQDLSFSQVQDGMRTLARNARQNGDGAGTALVMRLAPVMDGHFLPVHPFDPSAAATAAGVPLMIGSNRDEAALFVSTDPRRRRLEEPELLDRVTPILGEKRDQVLDAYRKEAPGATPWDLFVSVSSERTHLASKILADRKVAADAAPVYMYLMTWETDFAHGLLKSCHALDLPFVFDNVGIAEMAGEKPDRFELAGIMSDAWIAFARHGDPSHPGIPQWPPYNTQDRPTMLLDVPSRVENDPRKAIHRAWEGVALRR